MGKATNARLGAVIYVGVTAGAVAVTMALGWCADERYTKRDLLTGLERPRLATCGFVRGITGDLLEWVPCQVWNLMPLTLVAAFALVWLVRDLFRARG